MPSLRPNSHTHRHADIVRETVQLDSAAAKSLVAASWTRSLLHHGLAPETSLPPNFVTDTELCQAKENLGKLLSIAEPMLTRLFCNVGKTGCCVIVTDKSGIVLEMLSEDGDKKDFKFWGLTAGANWSEAAEGTNGIGTCIAEKRPVTIFKDQHFHSRNTDLSCTDAPIYDENGDFVAALNISTCNGSHTDVIVSLIADAVQDAASRIETENFKNSFPNARIIMCETSTHKHPALIATDADDLVIGATYAARKNYGLTNERLASPLPADDILKGTVSEPNLGSAERAELRRALARTNGNVSAAAKRLNISRATLYRRMKKLGLT